MFYNQQTEQHDFNSYLTESVWLQDCQDCANEPHETNAITHECYVCSEFTPHTTTFNWFDTILLGIAIASVYFFIRIFSK